MDQSYLIDLTQEGLSVALIVSMPILAVTLFIGLVVSVFQAVTQVQEMTLTYVPKLIAASLALVVFGSWMISTMVGFTRTCLTQATRITEIARSQ